MAEADTFEQRLKTSYEAWYVKRGIAQNNTRGKIDFLKTQLCGTYRIVGEVTPEVELSLLEEAHFLEQV